MKRFLIISLVLLLASGGIFGFALKHYIDSTKPDTVQKADAPAATAPTESSVEDPTLNPDDGTLDDQGVFAAYYEKAQEYVSGMSKEQMVGQMIIDVADDCTEAVTDINRYYLGGVLFSSESFDYMTKDEVKAAVERVRAAAPTAPILAAQEEGGRRTTVSGHAQFDDVSFDSPRNIYESGGLGEVERTEDRKTEFLKELGFNVNLAPVLDLAKEYNQIMYSRSLCGDAQITSQYAEYVSKFNQAKGVSVVLKHFPGYGTINDTYDVPVVDTRAADTLRNEDYLPFKAGAAAGAHFVMVSNVLVQNLDSERIASLSPAVHEELRNKVGFTGLIITDVLDNGDYSAYSGGKDPVVAAVIAGNDLILVKDGSAAYNTILAAVNDGTIGTSVLQEVCTRIIAYKYAAGLMK